MEFEYVIKMENGNPVDHPIIIDNFKQCYSQYDLENLPDTFAYFRKVDRPTLNAFQELKSIFPKYVKGDDGVVYEEWEIFEYSLEEKQRLIDLAKSEPHPSGWLFDESTCFYVPPIPYPEDGNKYIWDDATENWILFQE